MATIYAFSVDYDGCLADRGVSHPKMNALIREICFRLREDPDSRVILMVGSYRQSMASDVYCLKINRNGSCFPVYEYILSEFKRINPNFAHRISLDKFLLADIEEKKSSGAHFESAVRLGRVDAQYQAVEICLEPVWHDKKKCGLQYVQMHHLAAQFHNDTIMYYFHDNCDDLILKPSHQFFSKFNFCVPGNVTLTHFCYVLGYYQKQSTPIKGSGHIDFNYRQNILQFEGVLDAPIPQANFSSQLHNVSNSAHPDENLRLVLLRSCGRFFPFWQLVQTRGREFVDDFIARLQNPAIQKEYDGYLLHPAIAQNNVEAVNTLLSRGANYLALNERGKQALECAVQSNDLDMILCFVHRAAIEKTDDHLMRFVSSMSTLAFYHWIDSLIEKKLNRSVEVLLCYRLKDAAALSAYYINTYLKIKSGMVRCTKKFFFNLIEVVMKNQGGSSMVDNLYRLYFHASIFPGDYFEEPALQALCFFVDEFLKRRGRPADELLFAILMLLPEITEKMQLANHTHDQMIEHFYQRFLGYQAVMMGKIKEELNDLHVVSLHITNRFVCSEGEIIAYLKRQHDDVPWLPMQTSIVNTPKQIILEAIRKQSIKNRGNERINAIFFSLECMVAQAVTLPLVIELIDSWKRLKIEPLSRESVSDLLMNADDNAGCGCFSFFSPKNMGFLTQLPEIIEAVSRYS